MLFRSIRDSSELRLPFISARPKMKTFSDMLPDTVNHREGGPLRRMVWAAAAGLGLALAALLSYDLATKILTSAISSRDDQMLGGMWSVVATLFVCRESYRQSVSAALSRTAATSVSFILCLGYLLVFPFSSWGMTALITIGAMFLILIGRPEDVMTTSITTAVVLVVAGISPQRSWAQPILRLVDTLIGIAVGITAAWTERQFFQQHRWGAPPSQGANARETTKEVL